VRAAESLHAAALAARATVTARRHATVATRVGEQVV
jgi:hypothetical protein